MDNSLYIGLSRQMVLKRQMDVIANNIANVDTTGFKLESLMSATDPQTGGFTLGGPKALQFVTADGVARDFGQGALHRTDGRLDMAIEGKGFFKVTTPQGERYTRDGRFRTDATGKLTTQAGDPVADDGGGEITIDPQKGQVSIAEDGTVSQGEERIGKVGVFSFDNLSGLEKTGDNLFQNTSNLQATAVEDAKVRQGMLEGSNVQPVVEISRMIEVSRAYEQVAKFMDSQGDLSNSAIQRLGKVQ